MLQSIGLQRVRHDWATELIASWPRLTKSSLDQLRPPPALQSLLCPTFCHTDPSLIHFWRPTGLGGLLSPWPSLLTAACLHCREHPSISWASGPVCSRLTCLGLLDLAVVTSAVAQSPVLSSVPTGPSIPSESPGSRGGARRSPLAGAGRRGSQALVSKLGESSRQGL